MDGDNLGPVAAWQIKEFPVGVRHRVIDAAAAQKVSVGEYVTRGMLAYLDGQAGLPSPRSPLSFADLREAAQAMAAMHEASGRDVPNGLRTRFNRAMDTLLRATLGLPPSKPRQPPVRIGADPATRIESGVPDSATK